VITEVIMRVWLALGTFLFTASLVAAPPHSKVAAGYPALEALFQEWRAFARPRLSAGVPDYGTEAMAAQYAALPAWQARLAALDTRGWTLPQRNDRALVAAEMAGLEFDHRVRRPWATDPAFYRVVYASQSDTPAPEGVAGEGVLEIWRYSFPVTGDTLEDVRLRLRAAPERLRQARTNLTGHGRDLWRAGIAVFRDQADALEALTTRLASAQPELALDARRAAEAAREFHTWLQTELPRKQDPSGIGIEAYDWHARHVRLTPYTWTDQVAILQRELERAQVSLALEEVRNRDLPAMTAVTVAAEHDRRSQQAVTEFLAFARERDIFTVEPFMDAALRAQVGRFLPSSPPREFFREVDHHDPMPMRVHDMHWIELARMDAQPHASPIRRGALLFNIWVDRAEGIATGLEEQLLVAGLYDPRPRSRELVWVLLAQRAARGLGDLMMHANRWTLDEAVDFTVANTPRGWLRADGRTVWREQHLYLQQPGYGTSYVVGKAELDALLAERQRLEGPAFSLRAVFDAVQHAGMIPLSLIRTELAGATR
jgi:hypothetical protein